VYDARGVVGVEQGGAEEEDGREDEAGQEPRRPERLLGLPAEDEHERDVGEDDDEPERREASEGVHEVGPGEAEPPAEAVDEAEPLDHDRGNREADEGEPEQPREDEELHEHRERREHEDAGDEAGHPGRVLRLVGDADREQEGSREDDGPDGRGGGDRRRARQCGPRHAEEGRPDADEQGRPEPAAVEAQRLRHQLPDGPLRVR
jgi:hypothetical protein